MARYIDADKLIKEIDEVHTLKDDTIYQALINGIAGKEREK